MAKVVLIDDDKAIGSVITQALVKKGFAVDLAPSRVCNNKFIQERAYDVVITDILMPAKSGLQIIRELRQAGSKVFIIAISGGCVFGQETVLDFAKLNGADCCLTKPIELDKLINLVSQSIEDKKERGNNVEQHGNQQTTTGIS